MKDLTIKQEATTDPCPNRQANSIVRSFCMACSDLCETGTVDIIFDLARDLKGLFDFLFELGACIVGNLWACIKDFSLIRIYHSGRRNRNPCQGMLLQITGYDFLCCVKNVRSSFLGLRWHFMGL